MEALEWFALTMLLVAIVPIFAVMLVEAYVRAFLLVARALRRLK